MSNLNVALAAAALLSSVEACEVKIPEKVEITLRTPDIRINNPAFDNHVECFRWVQNNFEHPTVGMFGMMCNPG